MKILKLFPFLYFSFIFIFLISFLATLIYYYFYWQNNTFTKYFLPPYQNYLFLVKFVLNHYFYNYFVSLGLSLIFLGLALILNLKFEEKFFEPEEPYFFAFFLFILNRPFNLYYFVLVLLGGVLWHFVRFFIFKKQERLSFYYWWLIFGFLVFIFKFFLV